MIKVNADSRLSAALGLHPDVLQYIIELDPHDFRRLEQAAMRRVMPQRLTLRRVSRLSGVPLSKILVDLHRIAGIELTEDERASLAASSGDAPAAAASASPDSDGRPEWATDLADEDVTVVDLIADDARPVSEVSAAALYTLGLVGAGDVMLVKSASEPLLLYPELEASGADHFAEQVGPSEWWIFVRKA